MGWSSDWSGDWSGDWSSDWDGDWGADCYVSLDGSDANDGRDWANAKYTIADALNVVGSGNTLHIDFGDYSGQGSTPFVASVILKPEDKDGTATTGTVILPPTA